MHRGVRSSLFFVCLSLACAGTELDRRISGLEGEERQRQARLEELTLQISAAESRVVQAKAEAEFQECTANAAKVESQIAVERAECLRVVAERSACISKNESRTATGAGLGYAAGWILALATGGAAAPAVVIGCTSGAVLSETSKQECGDVPKCGMVDDASLVVLRRGSLAAVPACSMPTPAATPRASEPPRSLQRSVGEECATWRVEWLEFEVPRRKRSGDAWDTDGSAPDLAYMIAVDGDHGYRSQKYETFRWKHSPQAEVAVAPGQTLLVELVDRDFVSDDRIAAFELEVPPQIPANAAVLTSGRMTAHVKFACAGR